MAIDLSKYKLDTTNLEKYKITRPSQPLSQQIWSRLPAPTIRDVEESYLTKGAEAIKERIMTGGERLVGEPSPIGKIAELGTTLSGVTAETLKTAFAPIGMAVEKGIEKVSDIKTVQDIASNEKVGKFLDTASNIMGAIFQNWEEFSKTNPRLAEGIADNAEILLTVMGEKPVQGAVSKVLDTADDVAKRALKTAGELAQKGLTKSEEIVTDIYKKLVTQSEKQIESSIIKTFEKGVKPLLPGKTTPLKQSAYKDSVIKAVKTIKENSTNLKYTDELGEVITGETPKSLQQFSESIEQTKKTIFNKYDSLAKEAGQKGLEIDAPSITNELNDVINNKALSLTNPKAIQYAKDVQERYLDIGKIDAETAQEVIKNYNNSLEAFYKNPSYDSASQAAIDALVANKIRTALDEGITGLTGEKYQELKNQYGALKSIERDVVKATLRDARKNVKGLIDFSDILSGGNVVNGLLSLNPSQFATGLAQKGIAEYIKFLNNPNRAIENMFKVAEKLPVNAI